MSPDPEFTALQAEAEKARLQAMEAQLTESDRCAEVTGRTCILRCSRVSWLPTGKLLYPRPLLFVLIKRQHQILRSCRRYRLTTSKSKWKGRLHTHSRVTSS